MIVWDLVHHAVPFCLVPEIGEFAKTGDVGPRLLGLVSVLIPPLSDSSGHVPDVGGAKEGRRRWG